MYLSIVTSRGSFLISFRYFQIYCVIGLFDYFRVTTVWIKHWWRDETLAWFRRYFCEPQETANTLCAPPVGVNVTGWCLLHFNSTECGPIRDEAQSKMLRFMLSFYYVNAVWGVCLVMLVSNFFLKSLHVADE